MGSWNGTCGISHLPICYQDPVKVLIIKNGHYQGFHQRGGGFCNSDSFFKLVGLPLDGKYEDYGLPDEYVDNPASRWMYDHLLALFTGKKWGTKVILDPRQAKENIPDIATKPETTHLKDLVRTVERGGVWSPHRPYKEGEDGWNEPYGIFLVHRGMWDQILKKHHHPEGESWYLKYKEDFQKIKTFIEIFERPTKTDNPQEYMTKTWEMSTIYDGLFHRIGMHFMDLIEMFPNENIQPEHRKDVLWTLERMSESATVIGYLDSIRLGLMPQFGAGSQAQDYEAHMELATWTQALAKKLKKRRS